MLFLYIGTNYFINQLKTVLLYRECWNVEVVCSIFSNFVFAVFLTSLYEFVTDIVCCGYYWTK